MKKMNKIYKILIFNFLIFGLVSCLKSGLDELPAFEDAEITNVFIEHRYEDPNDTWIDGSNKVKIQELDLTRTFVKAEDSGSQLDSIVIVPSIPAPSGSFTAAERRNVTLQNIVVYVDLSTAAKIEPLEGAPVLGRPGDFSQPRKYKVTAADGKTSRTWVIMVKPLPEINQYEGFYQESGTLVRVGNPADNLDAEVYLQTVDTNTCKAQAAKSVFNNPGITYFIKVNTDNSVTILPDPNAVVAIYPQDGTGGLPNKPSSYDPATKTFDLHYHYRNGARLFDTKLVLR